MTSNNLPHNAPPAPSGSAPSASSSATTPRPATRRVVDAATRTLHWLMALSFTGAYITADGERWRLVHVTLGYTLAGLVVARLLWGVFGPRQVRMSVLWRKLPGARSAGCVQSVALRLVCDRELEIEKFVAKEYWSLLATLITPRGDSFEARLVGADGRKLQRLDIGTGAEAEDFKKALELEVNLISLCFATEDQKEGMAAFVEKRKPAFRHR